MNASKVANEEPHATKRNQPSELKQLWKKTAEALAQIHDDQGLFRQERREETRIVMEAANEPRFEEPAAELRERPDMNASQAESWPYEDRPLGIAASGAICIISTAEISAVIGSVVDLFNASREAS